MCFYNFGLVSDTHDSSSNVEAALRTFKEYEVDLVIHCGDITSPAIIPYFQGFNAHFVYGNCDEIRGEDHLRALREEIERVGCVCHGFDGSVEWHGKKIFFTHGDRGLELENAIYSGEWDAVCYGHTHVRDYRKNENTVVMNPGKLGDGSYCVVSLDLEPEFFDV